MSDTGEVPATSTVPEENDSCFPCLSKPVRIIAMIICIVVGLFIGIASFTDLISGGSGYWLTFGNLLCVLSTLFIQSFSKQVKQMMQPIRATCTIVLLISMVVTIVLEVLKISFLNWIAYVVQYFAMVWYILSYIPGGQVFCENCLKSCCAGCKAACCNKQQSEKEAPIV